MTGFVVERYWPGVTEAEVVALGIVLSTLDNPDVVYLGSVLIPGDETVLVRFDAGTATLLRTVATGAGLRCDRVVPARFFEPRAVADR